MDNRNKTYMAPLLMTCLLLMGFARCLDAGFVKFWQLKETAAAPVLVVGRVVGVQQNERVVEGSPSPQLNTETWAMTAEIEVLRSHTASGEPVAANRLKVHFLAYGPSVTRFVNGYPPPLPHIEPGQVLILPLQENKNPVSEVWRLMAESGVSLTIPSRAEFPDSRPSPATARLFLVREIGNMLSRGTGSELAAIARYLGGQNDDVTGELMPTLEPAIGTDRQRWADVATSLLAAQGIPRPSVADLISGKTESKDSPLRGSLFLAQAALRKLGASPEADTPLIKAWIREAQWNAWGSANSLIEYAANPVTIETLQSALQNGLSGSSYIALVLVRNGNRAILPDALTRALKVADRPDADSTDLQGAAALLRDYGTDQQLKQLADLVRKYQAQDRKFYGVLWQYATESGNPREARVLAVVLGDRRIVSGETRYCDFALGVLERAVGQHFGTGGKTVQQRDDAVSKALAWLKSQGLSN
jgi:hypothetical protein